MQGSAYSALISHGGPSSFRANMGAGLGLARRADRVACGRLTRRNRPGTRA